MIDRRLINIIYFLMIEKEKNLLQILSVLIKKKEIMKYISLYGLNYFYILSHVIFLKLYVRLIFKYTSVLLE